VGGTANRWCRWRGVACGRRAMEGRGGGGAVRRDSSGFVHSLSTYC
jgi:hypothetical protein